MHTNTTEAIKPNFMSSYIKKNFIINIPKNSLFIFLVLNTVFITVNPFKSFSA